MIHLAQTIYGMEDDRPKLDILLENQALYELKNRNIHLFDGILGNNQCHINALVIAKIYDDWLTNKQNNLGPEIMRYLSLNLLFS